jgi:hypothetical protein
MWTKNDVRDHSAGRRKIVGAWMTAIIFTSGIFLVSTVVAAVMNVGSTPVVP